MAAYRPPQQYAGHQRKQGSGTRIRPVHAGPPGSNRCCFIVSKCVQSCFSFRRRLETSRCMPSALIRTLNALGQAFRPLRMEPGHTPALVAHKNFIFSLCLSRAICFSSADLGIRPAINGATSLVMQRMQSSIRRTRSAGSYCSDGERPMNLSAHWMKYFIFGASVWPPSCCRQASWPSSSPWLTAGIFAR